MKNNKEMISDLDYEAMEKYVQEKKRKEREYERSHVSGRSRDRERGQYRDQDRQSYRNRDRHLDRDEKEKRVHKEKEFSRSRQGRNRKNSPERRDHHRDRSRRRDSPTRHGARRDSPNRHGSRDRRKGSRDRKDKALVEKTIEEARRQAIEAQRDDCTILVYRLAINVTEKDIFRFFTDANIGKVIDIKLIRDPRTEKPKGVAYVEFETQDSVPLGVGLSGLPIKGQAVMIQSSQADKNRAAKAAKYKKEMIKEQQRINTQKPMELPEQHEGPARIFVGGLEYISDITQSDLEKIFDFGNIDYIEIPKDPYTGKIIGYAYIQFRKESQARKAITAMNGFNYKGKLLRVEMDDKK